VKQSLYFSLSSTFRLFLALTGWSPIEKSVAIFPYEIDKLDSFVLKAVWSLKPSKSSLRPGRLAIAAGDREDALLGAARFFGPISRTSNGRRRC
jgi:hypothetical protein